MKMMELKKYSPEMLKRLKYEICACGNFGAVRTISEFEETFGYLVKVVRGRKVKKGTVGRCFWMGMRSYAKYSDPWGLKTVTRIGLRDEAGQVYWTSLNKVEVIAGTYEAPTEQAKKYDREYYKLTIRPLYGMEESSQLRELREKLEAASSRYNGICNKVDELMDKEREQEKAGNVDEELSRMVDEALDEEGDAKKELEK